MTTPQLIARASTAPSPPVLAPGYVRRFDPELDGEWFDPWEARFVMNEISKIVGAETATLMKWRRDYNLLSWSPGGGKGHSVKWSLMDVFVMRLLVVMIDHGIKPRDAAWFCGTTRTPKELAMSVVVNLGALLADPKIPSLVAFYVGGSLKNPDDKVSFNRIEDSHENVEHLIARIKDSSGRRPPAITILDLRSITEHVCDAMGIEVVTKPEGL